MEGRGAYLRVGLLILVGGTLVVALIWFLGGASIRSGTLLETYFQESVQGLEVGGAVKYRGVTIGRVTEIGLVAAEYGSGKEVDPTSSNYRLVFARYEVDTTKIGRMPDIQVAVAQGLRCRLASQGITGLSYLELDFVDPTQYRPLDVPWHPKAPYIPSMPSTLTQVQDAAQHVLAKLNAVDIARLSTELTGLLTDLREDLATGDVHTTLQEATTLLHTLDSTVRAADLPALTADIRQTSQALRETVRGAEVKKLLTDAASAADRFATAAARLPALISAMQATTQRASNGAADLERNLVPLIRDMQATAQNLREMTDTLRRYPAQVLSQPPPRSAGTTR